MWKTVLAAVAVCTLAVGVWAQESATIVLRSGEKLSGQLVDMGASGFEVRVNGQSRKLGKNDVAVIDFGGSGEVSDADWSKLGGEGVILKNGETVKGTLYDIGGTSPLRITVRTDSGERNLTSNEVGRIVLAKPSSAPGVATSGSSSSPSIPEGQGVAVPANQQWTPAGLMVRQGDRLTFTATGEVKWGPNADDMATPNGARSQAKVPNAPVPGVFAGALIGRVGNNGEPFPIGANQTVTMPATGQLFLGINDDNVSDNQGGFRVVIRRQGRR